MAPTDRYVFAKVDPDAGPKALHLITPTDIPAPDPADWQKVVEAVEAWEAGEGDGWKEYEAVDGVLTAAEAAVRNMREAQNDG